MSQIGELSWRTIAAVKRNSIHSLIPDQWHLPSQIPPAEWQRDIEITEANATDIAQQTATGKWRATRVVKAFCYRAAIARQMVNCLHEVCFSKALAVA
ncbi:uncharacterized protein A1O9_01658 [Exophiala aquamarina CBS 119918]|uniref:Uncharacterized protein n=1 Tax=Exophiala aquamarina CBS 119918 TaxID=1182545 RepID=A0A072Q6W5_9EURO|nr:uncharacterized protein A1O9_01658 [Exophiala aquamarina CBS 119918]KEF63680.1 hypothetical protein A1O9_01658 [Exophiala aquamarina CBS 119918]